MGSMTAISPEGQPHTAQCHGFWYNAVLAVPATIFVVYLIYNARKSVRKLWDRRSYVMIAYYILLWLAASLNLLWSFVQAFQCSREKEVAWTLLSLFTGTSILCLEFSILAFLLQDSYATGLETLTRNFVVAGIISAVDFLFKAVFVFGFGVPLFVDVSDGSQRSKWGFLVVHKLVLAGVYGYILFVHFSKWREKLPPRPAFHNYIAVMFGMDVVALFACSAAGMGAAFGVGLYSITNVCYHALYLPFLYVTFVADFFRADDFLLDNAYYAEMRDAGFFDADWE